MTESLPLQGLKRSCPDCGQTAEVGIVNYWDDFEVVGWSTDGTVCDECGNTAQYRIERAGFGPRDICASCAITPYLLALDQAKQA
jgi:hypothetical protein